MIYWSLKKMNFLSGGKGKIVVEDKGEKNFDQ